LADRYTGRHIRTARNGVWLARKNRMLQPSGQLLPTAAAVTVAGLLIGGAGTVINLGAPAPDSAAASDTALDAANFQPPDPSAMTGGAPGGYLLPDAAATPPGGSTTASGVSGSCEADFSATGGRTASGETFDPNALTAASSSLPFNTRLRVTNVANGKSVVVRVNDRGPSGRSARCLDLSQAAFGTIANLNTGVIDVRYVALVQDAT
jgi:rare lipoprotein A